jgi:hypothetical protein
MVVRPGEVRGEEGVNFELMKLAVNEDKWWWYTVYWIKLTECSLLTAVAASWFGFQFEDEKNSDAGGLQSVRSQDDDKCCLQNKVRLKGRGGAGVLESPCTRWLVEKWCKCCAIELISWQWHSLYYTVRSCILGKCVNEIYFANRLIVNNCNYIPDRMFLIPKFVVRLIVRKWNHLMGAQQTISCWFVCLYHCIRESANVSVAYLVPHS